MIINLHKDGPSHPEKVISYQRLFKEVDKGHILGRLPSDIVIIKTAGINSLLLEMQAIQNGLFPKSPGVRGSHCAKFTF